MTVGQVTAPRFVLKLVLLVWLDIGHLGHCLFKLASVPRLARLPRYSSGIIAELTASNVFYSGTRCESWLLWLVSPFRQ